MKKFMKSFSVCLGLALMFTTSSFFMQPAVAGSGCIQSSSNCTQSTFICYNGECWTDTITFSNMKPYNPEQ